MDKHRDVYMDIAINGSSFQFSHKIDFKNQGSKKYFECNKMSKSDPLGIPISTLSHFLLVCYH